jgi:hypothetical protein
MRQDTSVESDSQGETSRKLCGPEVGNGQQLFRFASAKLPDSSPLGVPDYAPVHAIWKGSKSSNTDPSKLHSLEVCTVGDSSASDAVGDAKPLWIKYLGIDWLEIGVFGCLRNVNPLDSTKKPDAPLLLRLEESALVAREKHVDVAFPLGGVVWSLKPHGSGVGLNYFRYVLNAGSMSLLISSQLTDKAPVAKLVLTGEACHGVKPKQLLERCRRLLHQCSIDAAALNLGRVDICGDVVGYSPAFMFKQFQNGNLIRRTQRYEIKGEDNGHIGTVYFGKGKSSDYFLRVYDKVAELKQDPEKRDRYLKSMGWDELPEDLTRYEWQLNTSFWKECKRFVNAEDAFDSLSEVVDYLMHDTFRVCESVDRNHCERAKECDWWKTFREQMTQYLEGFAEYKPYPRPVPSVDTLLPQLLGVAASVLSAMGVQPLTWRDGFIALSSLGSVERDVVMHDKIELQTLEYETRLREFEAWHTPESEAA